jgi:hypothetical protein
MRAGFVWEINRNDYNAEMQSHEGCDYSIDFKPRLIIHKCLCTAISETEWNWRKEEMFCSHWLELIATGNQDVVLETNPNQMNLFKDRSVGFLRAALLREGPISFDFLVACIRSACVINKLTQHLRLLLTQCWLAVADWHTAQNLQLSRVTLVCKTYFIRLLPDNHIRPLHFYLQRGSSEHSSTSHPPVCSMYCYRLQTKMGLKR